MHTSGNQVVLEEALLFALVEGLCAAGRDVAVVRGCYKADTEDGMPMVTQTVRERRAAATYPGLLGLDRAWAASAAFQTGMRMA